MAAIQDLFESLIDRTDLVRNHSFDNGQDNGSYYNFTFGTEQPKQLWQLIQERIFDAAEHRVHLASSSMAMCSSESGWDTYYQLYHWDKSVPIEPCPAL